MKKQTLTPDFLFAASWEVCNKVGGIYTVLSTQAKTLRQQLDDHLVYLGPDFGAQQQHGQFIEDTTAFTEWIDATACQGINIRVGRWNVPGTPIVVLVNPNTFISEKDSIYGQMWNDFSVDSLHAYGDYHEACMWAYAVGRVVEIIASQCLTNCHNIVFQAHEWMSGFALLHLKKACPAIATIFTTHATSIGRSITSNNKPLYDYFDGYNGDQMGLELCMEAKHSVEKQAALNSDCLTTVSHITDRECKQFLERACDTILPNGFEADFVPKGAAFTARRRAARKQILRVANALMGTSFADDTLIVTTGGRNDFRCKGYDAFIGAIRRLQEVGESRPVLAVMAVPCWTKEARQDLKDRLNAPLNEPTPLADPFITHSLYNIGEDRIVNTLRGYAIDMSQGQNVRLLVVPTYLDGNDGIINLTYYDWLIGGDLSIYPSYYEPWGYTCLESVAFGIPCLTTNLAGFGLWANEMAGHASTIAEGVEVISRTDSNYDEAVSSIARCILQFMDFDKPTRKQAAAAAKALSKKAQWKDFIRHYNEAFSIALTNNRNK